MWYVLSIHSSKYRKIDDELMALKIRRLYPMKTIWRKQRTGPRKRIDMPLIPSYMFVGLSFKSTSARSILSIDGVRRFLGVDGVPQSIRESEVKRLRDAQRRGDYDATRLILAQMLIGNFMTIQGGSFDGVKGQVMAVDDHSATIEVTILGRATSVKIDIDKLVA